MTILYFHLPYFHVSNNTVFFIIHFLLSAVVLSHLHRRSLDTFYIYKWYMYVYGEHSLCYLQTSNIRRNNSQNFFLVSSCSCLCPIRWSRVLSREWRCGWSSVDRRCSNCIWMIRQFYSEPGICLIILQVQHIYIYIHIYIHIYIFQFIVTTSTTPREMTACSIKISPSLWYQI